MTGRLFAVSNIIVLLIISILNLPPIFAAQAPMARDDVGDPSHMEDKSSPEPPVLTIKPREIDFGIIRPGEGVKGIFALKNVGAGQLTWSTTGPSGWQYLEKQKLTGFLEINQEELSLHLSFLDINLPWFKTNRSSFHVQLSMESANNRVIYQKEVTSGTYRETIQLQSDGGTRTIFFRFKIISGRVEPSIKVDPPRIDFGLVGVGEKITRQIQLNNKGTQSLKWYIEPAKNPDVSSSASPNRGRYISFLNDEIKGKGAYEPAGHLKDNLEIMGSWTEDAGYPTGSAGGFIRYRFSGSGIAVLFWKSPNGGKLNAFIGDKLIKEIDCQADQRERGELLIAEGLLDMTYVLTLVNVIGKVAVEGVITYGKEVKNGAPGWINTFPNSGVTTKETDYINVTVNTERLAPGWYGEDIIIQSTGGETSVELSLEVSADDIPKILDVYRYVKENDYLYTANPQAEAKRFEVAGFIKEGIAFQLFRAGTPGTVGFYRWYNPKKRDHFYSYDISGGGKSLSGYIYEGTIGNIATSRLTNTRELYRWFNPSKGTHFYSTDQNGEGHGKKGYRFEAIAGYVR